MSYYNRQFAYIEPISNDPSTLFSLLPRELRLELAIYHRNTSYTVTMVRKPYCNNILLISPKSTNNNAINDKISDNRAISSKYKHILNTHNIKLYSIPTFTTECAYMSSFVRDIRMFGKWYSKPIVMTKSQYDSSILFTTPKKGVINIKLIRECVLVGSLTTVLSDCDILVTEDLLNTLAALNDLSDE